MSKRIILRINKKTGKLTTTVEGIDGASCLTDPDVVKLEDGLGLNQDSCKLTDEFYKPGVQDNQQIGGS